MGIRPLEQVPSTDVGWQSIEICLIYIIIKLLGS